MQTLLPQCQLKLDEDKIRLFKTAVKFNFTVMNDTPGEWLKKARLEKGLNQTELAERSRVSKNYISLLEAGRVAQPRLYQLEKIEKALNMPPGHLRDRFLLGRVVHKQPKTFIELIEALEALGISSPSWAMGKAFEDFTAEDFEELKERIAADTEITIRRKVK